MLSVPSYRCFITLHSEQADFAQSLSSITEMFAALNAKLDAQAETLANFIRSQSSNTESYSVALRGKRALEACIKHKFECMLVILSKSRTL